MAKAKKAKTAKKVKRTTDTPKVTDKDVERYIEKKISSFITKEASSRCKSGHGKSSCHSGGCLYGLGAIGAAIFYISTATGFWNGVWGVIKALLWPAFLVFEALHFFSM